MSTVRETQAGSLERQSLLPVGWSLADLQRHLGDIPAERIRLDPPPGFATEADVLRMEDIEGRLYELENGVLVEKPMGWYESILATWVIHRLHSYLETNNLVQVLGEAGSLKILPGVVKIPDVSFISWSRFPKQKLPRCPIPNLIPDLVVEVLSDTNTMGEMQEKLKKYCESGVRLIWYIDPATRTAISYSSPIDSFDVPSDGEMDGMDVLPGLRMSLAQMFAHADRQAPGDDSG